MEKDSNAPDGALPAHANRHLKSSALLDLSNFDINAVLRGMQLTLVGGMFHIDERQALKSASWFTNVCTTVVAHRALQNPAMFTSDHYKQAAYAVATGIAIRLIVSIPVCPCLGRLFIPQLTHGQLDCDG